MGNELRGMGQIRDRVRAAEYLNRSEAGQTFVEYVTLVALLAVVIALSLNFLGPCVADTFEQTTQQFARPASQDDGDEGDDEEDESNDESNDGSGDEGQSGC